MENVGQSAAKSCDNPIPSAWKVMMLLRTSGPLVFFLWLLPVLAGPFATVSTCSNSSCHTQISAGKTIHSPLKAKGCPICHLKGEGSLHLPDKHPPLKPIQKSEIGDQCRVCHDEEAFGSAKYIHKAVKDKGCTHCHDPHRSSLKHLLKEKEAPAICLDCHEKIGKRHNYPHVGAMEKKRTCTNCHDAHGSNIEHLLKDSEPNFCLDCHDRSVESSDGRKISAIGDSLKENNFKHKPILEGRCSACHAVHGGENRSLLVEPYSDKFYVNFHEDDYGLCFKCHKANTVTQRSVTDETNFRNGAKNLHYLHVVIKGRSCRACHDIHAGKNKLLIKDWLTLFGAQIPLHFQSTNTGGGCSTACHGLKRYDRLKEIQNAPGK